MYDSGIPVCVGCSDARKAKRKSPASEQEIRTILFRDVLEATARNNEATTEFEALMSKIPSGLPHPDGVQRITNASRSLSIARKEKMKADNRFNDFLGRGVVPEDLKRSGKPQARRLRFAEP
jgi:hypothetical protein